MSKDGLPPVSQPGPGPLKEEAAFRFTVFSIELLCPLWASKKLFTSYIFTFVYRGEIFILPRGTFDPIHVSSVQNRLKIVEHIISYILFQMGMNRFLCYYLLSSV